MSQHKNELVEDWNAMVATVAHFSNKHDLPAGELVFPPVVLDTLRDLTREHLLSTFIIRGVRARFGRFEQTTAFKEY